jgi:hypothetical protein
MASVANDSDNDRNSELKRKSRPSLAEGLHIFTLFGFALSQPVFDILSQNPEFLIAHETTLADLLLAVFLPLLLAPLVVVLLEKLLGMVNENLRRRAHLFVVFCLLVAILNPPLKALPDSLDGLRALSAMLLGAAVAVAYSRSKSVKTFLTFLSPSVLIFPLIFLSHGHIWEAVRQEPSPTLSRPERTQSIHTGSDVPVVILVFDELPLTSLLDANRSIDAARYPHFAALARESTWYRNATTVADSSTFAIPSLVTGKYPDPRKIPISRHYPDTVFSLFAPSHEIEAFESATLLCPPDLQEVNLSEDKLRSRRLSLFVDTAIIYLRIVMPAKIAKHLPRVSHTWEGFGDPHEWLFKQWLGELASDRLENLNRFLAAVESNQEGPSLFFLHLLLPHSPFHFLPNGERYTLSGDPSQARSEDWGTEQIVLSYYRHLLQLGFVDQILGEIVGRLKQFNLYDRSVLCLASDHGRSFRIGDPARRITRTNAADISSVPLFIKAPGQAEGYVDDRSIELIDVLPTIAEILQVEIPWAIDGRAASGGPPAEQSKKRILRSDDREWVSFAAKPQALDLSLRQKIEWFGSGADENRIFFPTVRSSQIDELTSQIAKIYGNGELPHEK